MSFLLDYLFFFFKQKTAYEMRISDWSSDVCSSDLSPAWRKIVFGMSRDEIRQIAVDGVKVLRDEAAKQPDTDWHFEYSPETFSTAELDFSVEVCEAVMDVLQPTPERPLILNLPATDRKSTRLNSSH